jgi:hypothetical protein
MKFYTILGVALATSLLVISCKKDKEDTTPTVVATDQVVLKIEHTWADSLEFALNEDLVHPVTGDTLNFTTFKYYISNIRLKKADGTWWTQPNSYFLLDLTEGTTASVTLSNVPKGEYTDVEYILGVDSTMNVSGAQSGDLSPALDMFWSWNSGYIMLKAEGTCPNSMMGSFTYHLGGFSGVNSIVQTNTHTFVGNSLSVTGNGACQIHLAAAPQTLWSTIGAVDNVSMVHMPGANAKTIASDFYNSFEFEHIHE